MKDEKDTGYDPDIGHRIYRDLCDRIYPFYTTLIMFASFLPLSI